jgi:arylsulfatase A-like enzyme
MQRVFLLLAIWPWLACGDTTPAKKPASSSATEAKAAEEAKAANEVIAPAAPARIELAESPAIDLVSNRYLWHVYRSGLLLPMASEGMRKYNHEYARPWKHNVKHDGELGRVLGSRQSTLQFAWFDSASAATLRMRVHGLVAGQRVTVQLNGKTLANANLEASWDLVDVSVPPELLRQGENELKLHVAKASSVSGANSYALWQSIEIVPTGATQGYGSVLQPGAKHEAEGVTLPALGGFPRMMHLVEVPETAWLDFQTAGVGSFQLDLIDDKGARHALFSRSSDNAGWQAHQLSLSDYAGQLVRLELQTPEGGAWGALKIGLERSAEPSKKPQAKNLILLVVDALRADHVPLYASVYGDKSAVRMPNTQSEADKGAAVFLFNQAASPSSPPSHGSIQTGMIPRVHGVDGDRGSLNPGTPMISTQVVKAGLSAGYFGNNPFGMARLEAPGNWTQFHQPGMEGKSNDCTTLMKMMLDFSVGEHKAGKRFFISSLPYETHTPYRYHENISEHYYQGPWSPPLGKNVNGDILGALASGKMTLSDEQWKQLKGLYRGEAEYWDQCFGQLVTGLREANLLDDTVLILTSDHGEGMFEHGHMGHAFGHYRELGDVPFVVFWPEAFSGVRELKSVTSHRDIAPTILDILGIAVDPKVQGESVLPMALREGPWTPRVVSLEYGRSYSLRSRRYKLIADYNGLQEIYDLETDPWEKRDIKESGGDAVRYLRDMAGFFLEYRSEWHYSDWGTLNRHDQGLLRAAQARESGS